MNGTRTIPTLAILGTLCACSDETSTGPKTDPVLRAFSTSLRASCADTFNVAARSPVALLYTPNSTYTVVDSIFDSTGRFVAKGSSKLTLDSTQLRMKILLGWDGRDSSGTAAAAGSYFLFTRVLDSAGSTARRDSSCLVYRKPA